MPIREVVDQAGCPWRVWDTYPESARRVNVMPGYETGWLTFECDGEKRRLHPVPEDWTAASDPELLVYLAGALVVQGRLPRIAMQTDAQLDRQLETQGGGT